MSDLFWPGIAESRDHFSDSTFLEAMLAVEDAWLGVLVEGGLAPPDAAADLTGLVTPADLPAVASDAASGGNPVIPLVALLRSRAAEPAAKWLHRGLTSQDVVDSALMLCARDAVAGVRSSLVAQVEALAALAERHRATPMVARTLTQHAVPTTFGLKVATWLSGVLDAYDGLDALVFPVQVGGAAGTLAGVVELGSSAGAAAGAAAAPAAPGEAALGEVSKRLLAAAEQALAHPGRPATDQGLGDPGRRAGEQALAHSGSTASRLGLTPALPWHTARAPVTRVGDALVGCTDAWGRIANDVLTLSRPEIGELSEGVGGGSSTMPHKANPVLSTLIRRAALTTPQLAATLHLAAAEQVDERADGAWHAEWATLRDLTRRAVVAGDQAAILLSGLRVHPERMRATLDGARDDVHAEQRAIAALAGHRPGGDYLGAADLIIERVLDRARDRALNRAPDQVPERSAEVRT